MKKMFTLRRRRFGLPPAFAADVQLFGFFDQGVAFLSENLASTMGGPVGGKNTVELANANEKLGCKAAKPSVLGYWQREHLGYQVDGTVKR